MCGVLAVRMPNVAQRNLDQIRNLFLQSMVRGKHATGVTYYKNGELHTIKEPVPALEFMNRHDPSQFVDENGNVTLIGHTRYSTSDLEHNQPFQGNGISIAHNGVISQDPEVWEYDTETRNDSELILRCIENGDDPVEVYKKRSMSCVAIEIENGAPVLRAWRNHERPLWYFMQPQRVVFASTSDILSRSGFSTDQTRTKPLCKYTFARIFVTANYIAGPVMHEDQTVFDHDLEDLQP